MHSGAAKPHYRAMHGGAARLPRGSQPSADSLTWRNLEKIYFFHTILDEDDHYIKIVALDEIYNFLVLSFFHLR
jgi:hypothetical protein